tara:strand:- start:41 stop:352 length:312 start_codon:yes stop_codon:yes gene_type:complete
MTELNNSYRTINKIIEPNKETPYLIHFNKNTHILIIDGNGSIQINNKFEKLIKNKYYNVDKTDCYKIINNSNQNLQILEIQIHELIVNPKRFQLNYASFELKK